ncbi:hypothetical protein CDCA_CDCA16G4160 [Cyanidium caldarium]|uniref:Small ribosomal subunit protein eS31 domain-containing protein n=1 Tax=Cyanidium caldarium TaxID=2771 RepID=A0AAV9J1E0_CYACA|nr:hypothetical protein CDCA_CDCA16G4160 [Cyanidium caldarium]
MIQALVRLPQGATRAVDLADDIHTLPQLARSVGLDAASTFFTTIGGRPVRALDDWIYSSGASASLVYLEAHARLLGGGKKRKKKVYTTPKKIKHKHKKVKMAALKYYQVDDDNKVARLRKECPSECCGAGIFMAEHRDRLYCGKCQLTLVK